MFGKNHIAARLAGKLVNFGRAVVAVVSAACAADQAKPAPAKVVWLKERF